ncbi:hypothetical protein ACFIOY_08680 [Bradyrhizobium sp. TZ2]
MPSVEIRPRLHHVAFVDGFALVQDNRDAVADRGRVANQFGDVTDHLGRDARAAVGLHLRILGVAGQRVDDISGEVGAIGRSQRRPLLALEVILQDEFAVIAGENEVDARPLEIAGEEQMGIRNNNGVGRRMCRNFVDTHVPNRLGTLAVGQQIGEFTGQAQKGTIGAKVNIYTILKGLNLHITGQPFAEPIYMGRNLLG